MAVAYFTLCVPRGFFPINNGGEEAVINCFLFLWLVTAGPGPGAWTIYFTEITRRRRPDLKPTGTRI